MPSETTTTPRHILTVTESNWDLEVTQENWELTLTYTDGNPITITNELVNAAIEDDPAATGVSLGLGTAAYAETTDFATAAQGTDERVPTAAGLTSKFSTAKATPVDNDRVAIFDSAASNAPKHTLWSSVKSTLKSYFDTVYAAIVHTHVSADITDASPITASNGGKVLKSTAEGTLESISIVTASSSYLQVGVSGKDGVAAFSSYGNRLDGTAIAEIYMQRSSTAEASIRVDNLTGVREIQFPDASGTLALTSDITDAVTSNTTSDGTCDLWINTLTVGSVGAGGVLDVQDNGTWTLTDTSGNTSASTADSFSVTSTTDESAVVTATSISVGTPTTSASLSGNGNIDGTGDLTIGGTGSFGSDVTVDGTTTTDTVQFDTTVTSATAGVGELNWNDSDGTLNLGLKGGNVTLQIGQESVARVVNKTGANLLESQYRVVRIRSTAEGGAQGQRLAVVLAQANNDPNSVDTLGLVTENINVNEEGFVTTSGLVRGINTTGSLQGESWVDGDVLYLSPTTAGQLTKVKPQAPQHTVIVGFVVYAHNSQGKIYVKVDNGYELDELHNVRISGVVDGEFLMYNGVDEVWGNYAIDKVTVGLDQVDNTSDLDKPISTATQDALDLKADWSNPVRTTLTGDGTTTVFAISGAGSLTNPAALIVAIDGVLQESGVDYSVSGGNITFTDPLASGAKAVVISPTNTVQVGEVTPSDGSVTSSKLDPNLTLTNMTVTGTAAFTSTTRPTSAGTGTPAATSLMTRDDVDARGGRMISVTLTTDEAGDANTTTLKTSATLQMTLEVGTWDVECLIIVNCNNTTAGNNQKLNFAGTASSVGGAIYVAINGATTSTTYPNSRQAGIALDANYLTSGGSTASYRVGRIVVTASGVLSAQFSQRVATAGTSPTLVAGSYLRARKVS